MEREEFEERKEMKIDKQGQKTNQHQHGTPETLEGVGQVRWTTTDSNSELRTSLAHDKSDPNSLNLPFFGFKGAGLSSVRSDKL